MSHKCGPGWRRKQTPITRKDCPSWEPTGVRKSITAGGRTKIMTQHMVDDRHLGITKKTTAHVLHKWVVRGSTSIRMGA